MTSIFGASEHHLVKTSILKLDPNFINTKSSVSSFIDAILQSNFPDKKLSLLTSECFLKVIVNY